MLKIGTIRWKGRCTRHPQYDPQEGEGGIRGACSRCYALLEIYQHHRRLMELIRTFGPMRERASDTDTQIFIDPRQRSLFE
jgi:hypothetical protein